MAQPVMGTNTIANATSFAALTNNKSRLVRVYTRYLASTCYVSGQVTCASKPRLSENGFYKIEINREGKFIRSSSNTENRGRVFAIHMYSMGKRQYCTSKLKAAKSSIKKKK